MKKRTRKTRSLSCRKTRLLHVACSECPLSLPTRRSPIYGRQHQFYPFFKGNNYNNIGPPSKRTETHTGHWPPVKPYRSSYFLSTSIYCGRVYSFRVVDGCFLGQDETARMSKDTSYATRNLGTLLLRLYALMRVSARSHVLAVPTISLPHLLCVSTPPNASLQNHPFSLFLPLPRHTSRVSLPKKSHLLALPTSQVSYNPSFIALP